MPRLTLSRPYSSVSDTPGNATLTMPPQLHIAMESLLNIGIPLISTVGQSGSHGASVIGMHGMGVSIPSAAIVAARTIGLAKLMHIPNGIMFISGMWSMIVAPGIFLNSAMLIGSTTKGPGATPKEH